MVGDTVVPASCNWNAADVAAVAPSGALAYASRHVVHFAALQNGAVVPLPGVVANTHKVTAAAFADVAAKDVLITGDDGGAVKIWVGAEEGGFGAGAVRAPTHTFRMQGAVRSVDAGNGRVVACDYTGAVASYTLSYERGAVACLPCVVWTPLRGIPTVVRLCPWDGATSLVALGYTTGKVIVVDTASSGGGVASSSAHHEEIQGLAWLVSTPRGPASHLLLASSAKDQRLCLSVVTPPAHAAAAGVQLLRPMYVPPKWVTRRNTPGYPYRFTSLHVPPPPHSAYLLAGLGAAGCVLGFNLAPYLATGAPPTGAAASDRVAFYPIYTVAGGEVVYSVRTVPAGAGLVAVCFTRGRRVAAVALAEKQVERVLKKDTEKAKVGKEDGTAAPESPPPNVVAQETEQVTVLAGTGHAQVLDCVGGPVYCVDAYPDARHAVAGCGDNTAVHTAAHRHETVGGFAAKVTAIAAAPDGRSGFAFGLADGSTGMRERAGAKWTTRVYRSSTKKAIYTLAYSGGLWVPCERALYSLAADGMIYERALDTGAVANITPKLWKAKKDALAAAAPHVPADVGRSVPSAFAWAPCGDGADGAAPPRLLVVGCRNGVVDIWGVGRDAAWFGHALPLPPVAAGTAPEAARTAPPLPAAAGAVCPLYLLATLRCRPRSAGEDAAELKLNSIDAAADGWLAIGATDGTVRVLQVCAGAAAPAVPGSALECVHNAGVHAVCVGMGAHHANVNSVRWCPAGGLLATGSYDGTAQVWAAGAGGLEPLLSLRHHEGKVYSVAWGSMDAAAGDDTPLLLYTASDDHTLRCVDVRAALAGAAHTAPPDAPTPPPQATKRKATNSVDPPAKRRKPEGDKDAVVEAAHAWAAQLAGADGLARAAHDAGAKDTTGAFEGEAVPGAGGVCEALRELAGWTMTAGRGASRSAADVLRRLPEGAVGALDVVDALLAGNDLRGAALAPLYGAQVWADTLTALAGRPGMPVLSAACYAATGRMGAAIEALLEADMVPEALCVLHAPAAAHDDPNARRRLVAAALAHARRGAALSGASPAEQERAMHVRHFAAVVGALYEDDDAAALDALHGVAAGAAAAEVECWLAARRCATSPSAQRAAVLNDARDKHAAIYCSMHAWGRTGGRRPPRGHGVGCTVPHPLLLASIGAAYVASPGDDVGVDALRGMVAEAGFAGDRDAARALQYLWGSGRRYTDPRTACYTTLPLGSDGVSGRAVVALGCLAAAAALADPPPTLLAACATQALLHADGALRAVLAKSPVPHWARGDGAGPDMSQALDAAAAVITSWAATADGA